MSIKLQISPMLLKSVASLYSDPHRVIMEYIDNSIDAAESFFDSKSNCYSRPIEIIVIFNVKSHEDSRIIVHDNCTGISNLTNLVTKIGNSSKLHDDSTNGQFAFGMYSFPAISDRLTIATRPLNTDMISRIKLNTRMFDSPDDNKYPIIEEQIGLSDFDADGINGEVWSRFILEGFNKNVIKELSVKSLKSEIENHFERILSRENIEIKIIDDNKAVHLCKSYDYNKYEGEFFYREIEMLQKTKSKKFRSKEVIKLPNKVVVYLKFCSGRVLNRKPVFISKGRRLVDVADVKAFRTNSKGIIWNHPNLDGYIDATGILEPKISRDDFKPNELTKALFQTLLSMEEEIKEFINRQLKLPSSKEYKNLEEFLSKTLSKLNKSKKFRNLLNFESGSKSYTQYDHSGNQLIDSIKLSVPKKINSPSGNLLSSNGSTSDNNDEKQAGDIDAKKDSKDRVESGINNKEVVIKEVTVKLTSTAKDTTQNNPIHNTDKTKGGLNGINIVIDCTNEPPLDSEDRKLRSSMINNQIIIYRKHPMFEERVKGNILGVQTISNELIFYISVEIITQIKILIYNENKSIIDDIGAFFNKYNEGVYLFVSELTKLAGKKLSELTNIN